MSKAHDTCQHGTCPGASSMQRLALQHEEVCLAHLRVQLHVSERMASYNY